MGKVKKIYKQGQEAFYAGKDADDCPHTVEEDKNKWLDGWYFAAEELAKRVEGED